MKRLIIFIFLLPFVFANAKIKCGADKIDEIIEITKNKRVALIVNQTSVTECGTHLVDTLKARGIDIKTIFAPEHGFRGNADAGESVKDGIDTRSGVKIVSLYGKNKKPSAEQLSDIDMIIFDIQDVGARFYTYQYTMTDAMKLCASHGIKFVVLDRPNPLGGLKAEGSLLNRRFSSFVGRFPTPTRPALTTGEFALMMNDRENIGCDLTVIKMDGWKRYIYYDDSDLVFIQPSPNIPTIDTVFCYIGTCIFEETNLSEGRGTTKPFEMIGAPWLDSEKVLKEMGQQEGVLLRECSFTPTFSDYKDSFCHGIQLHITDRDSFSPFEVGLRLLDTIRKTHDEFEFKSSIVNLLGTDEILKADFSPDLFITREAQKTAEWQLLSKKWYLY